MGLSKWRISEAVSPLSSLRCQDFGVVNNALLSGLAYYFLTLNVLLLWN